jgi:hypothetical protein
LVRGDDGITLFREQGQRLIAAALQRAGQDAALVAPSAPPAPSA